MICLLHISPEKDILGWILAYDLADAQKQVRAIACFKPDMQPVADNLNKTHGDPPPGMHPFMNMPDGSVLITLVS